MLTITLQDLRYRARQFLIAVGGAGLLFAMGLLLTGLAAGFGVEIQQTVQGLGSTSWVLRTGASGLISDLPPIPASAVAAVAQEPGVKKAAPIIVVPQAAFVGGKQKSVTMIGIDPGQLGSPTPATGFALTGNGQVVADSGLGIAIGQRLTISGTKLKVVGTLPDRTLLGGMPDVYVTIHDAQTVIYGSQPLIGGVITSGTATHLPSGLTRFSNSQIESASLTQLAAAVSSINNSKVFMWFIAAVIVAALIYVAALERTRDFAVLKALGSSSGLLFVGLAVQAVVVALLAAALAAVISNFMGGLFQQPVDIPSSAFYILPLLALAVGLLASLAALRRAVSADPAQAFAGP
jgi:putative ABC transport system permease protein